MTKDIRITSGHVVRVDDEDAHLLAERSWSASLQRHTFYVRTTINHKTVYLHRLITSAKKGQIVDHRDGDGLNNTRSNLRIATPQQNSANRAKRYGASAYKGVYRRREGVWWAAILTRGKKYWLGTYDSEIEAAKAYDRKAKELFGEWANLNFKETA